MKKKIVALGLMCIVSTPVFAIKEMKNSGTPLLEAQVQTQEMTLGAVQRDVKIGSAQSDVAIALGSPNIVTRDADGKDTWIYDKVSTISSYNNSGFGVNVILIGYNKSKEKAQTTQKTLTVVIKFDKANKVESFTYHMSKF